MTLHPDHDIPIAEPAVVDYLAGLGLAYADRVSTRTEDTLPCVRITRLYDLEPGNRWESKPVFQIEVWAADELVALHTAQDIANRWPDFRGAYGGAFVSGAWLHSGHPRPLPDPETSLPRALFEAALSIHAGDTP